MKTNQLPQKARARNNYTYLTLRSSDASIVREDIFFFNFNLLLHSCHHKFQITRLGLNSSAPAYCDRPRLPLATTNSRGRSKTFLDKVKTKKMSLTSHWKRQEQILVQYCTWYSSAHAQQFSTKTVAFFILSSICL